MRGFSRLLSMLGLALLATAAIPGGSAAQAVDSVRVEVRQVAGSNLYLDIGTAHGLLGGDTIQVIRDEDGSELGRVAVVAASEGRSVLEFVDTPFEVSSGDAVRLRLLRSPDEPVPADALPEEEDPSRGVPALRTETVAEAASDRPPVSGRITAELSGLHSTTSVGGADAIDLGRTFATPAIRVDLTAPELIGGFELNTSARLSYRYSDPGIVDPEAAVRLYDLSLERSFDSAPVHLEIGRFRSRAESYSGYWDGLSLRLGRAAVGVGALLGFQPDRWNGAPSIDRPKATVFVDGSRSGEGWSWHGDLSAHLVSGGADLPDHRFVGFSQRIRRGAFRLNQDLQMDRDPSGGTTLSYLRLQGSVALADAWTASAGYTRRRRYSEWRAEEVVGPRRDRVHVGLAFRDRAGGLGLDVSRSTSELRSASMGYRVYGDLSDLGFLGLAARFQGSYWTSEEGNSLSFSPMVLRSFGRAYLTAGYRLDRSDYLGRVSSRHGIDASLELPLRDRLRLSLQARAGMGTSLRTEQIHVRLTRTF